MLVCRVAWEAGAGVEVSPGRGVMVGGSEAQASITIKKIAIHTRRIDKLYQGSSYQFSVVSHQFSIKKRADR
jgi:hypothetical protein